MPEGRKLQLKVRRSQQQGVMGKVTFTLDARIEVPPDQAQLIAKYRLGDTVVYDSQARRSRTEEAAANFMHASVSGGLGGMAWRTLKGATAAAVAALTLRVTINSLMKGQHIACKDLPELLAAEAAIVDACQTIKAYLETAITFDGREDLIEI